MEGSVNRHCTNFSVRSCALGHSFVGFAFTSSLPRAMPAKEAKTRTIRDKKTRKVVMVVYKKIRKYSVLVDLVKI